MHSLNFLQSLEWFKDIDESAVLGFTRIARRREYGREEYVFLQDLGEANLYFFEQGMAKMTHTDSEGREHIFQFLKAKDVISGVSLFDHRSNHAAIQCLTRVVVWILPLAQVEDYLLTQPLLLKKVIIKLHQRIHNLHQWQQHLASDRVEKKILYLLERLAREYGKCTEDGIHLTLPVTQGELARLIGVRRESLNRLWSQLQKQSLLVSLGRSEWLLSPLAFQSTFTLLH